MVQAADLRSRLACAVLLLAACGRHHFDPLELDAADAPPVLGSFGAPIQLTSLASPASDDDVSVTGDLLELYFASTRQGGLDTISDIWMSSRAAVTDPWPTPVLVPNVNTNVEEQTTGVSADGLTLYFSSRRSGGPTGANIWKSTRALRSDPWGTPVVVTELSTNLDDFEPQPDPSELRLVMYRHFGGVDRAIFESRRASTTEPWSAPVQLTALDAPESERSPCLADDGLTIYFASDRESGMTDLHDIFSATRPDVDSAFGTPIQVPMINSAFDDDDPWISPDGRALFFYSNRSGNGELWFAER